LIIAFISDFGYEDHYAGAMKGAALSINPEVRVVDVCHGIRKFDVLHGAYVLAGASRAFPKGTIFVVVVDPGVGGPRRGILLECDGKFYVGPDNGVFTLIWHDGCRAWEIDMSRFPNADPTFHGRDVFAPVAALLSLGKKPEELGKETRDIILLPVRWGSCGIDSCEGSVIHIDSFGNVISNIRRPSLELGRRYRVRVGKWGGVVPFLKTYAEAEVGEPLLLVNSEGLLELSVREGSARELTGAERLDEFRVLK